MKSLRKQKLVSIIINCYNSEKYLRETLNSVLNQTYKKWELVFYDNQSTDNSVKIFKSFKDKRFKYFKAKTFENLGVARRNAFLKAKGNFIAFLDSDDIWLKKKLSKQLKFFNNKKVGFTISNSLFFNEFKSKQFYPKDKIFKKKIFYDLIRNYNISFDTVIMRSSYLKKLDHTLNKNFDIIHDMDLLIRLSKICEIRYCSSILSKWRMRDDSLSYNSFNKIIHEKKILINQLNKKYRNDENFLISKKIFLDTLIRQEILGLISKKNYFRSIKLFFNLEINLKNILLFFVIILPFKKYIFKNFFNLRYR